MIKTNIRKIVEKIPRGIFILSSREKEKIIAIKNIEAVSRTLSRTKLQRPFPRLLCVYFFKNSALVMEPAFEGVTNA